MKLKIAICLFGYFRKYNHLIENFNDFLLGAIQQYGEVDIFFSTWDQLNSTNCFSVKHGVAGYNEFGEFNLNDILEKYKPKNYLVGNFEQEKHRFNILKYDPTLDLNSLHPNIHENETLFNLAQYYHIFNSNKLRREYEYHNNFKYNIVITMRPDLFFLTPFDLLFKKIINEPNFLYSRTFYNEAFFVSTSEIIDKVSDVFRNIQCIVDKYGRNKFQWFEVFCPEHFYEYHLLDCKITLDKRRELGEHLFWYYPKKDFLATCHHIYSKTNHLQFLNYVINYLNRNHD